ncbi:MAG: GDP-mannose 4,6-dehydratase, partial [Planctomycetes bacterium]|nr:GDP-mannose 4,6-dehydratase [Planctomycetota bacterium]
PTKAMKTLGWKPDVSFPQLVTMMVDADLKLHAQTNKENLSKVA